MNTGRQHISEMPYGLVRALGAGIAYFCLAAITIGLTSDGRNHATIWVADPVILALLLHLPRAQWKPVLLAGLIANQLANDAMRGFAWGHILYAVINMGQVWVAASLLQRRLSMPGLLSDIRTLGHFVLWAGLITPAIGGALGSLVTLVIYQQPFVSSFARWFFSNGVGFMVATPFFKSIWDGAYAECYRIKSAPQRWKMLGLLASYSALVAFVFLQNDMPLLFLPICALVLLTFPLGRQGIQIAMLITAIVGTLVTMEGHGPVALMHGGLLAKSAFFQFYLIMTLVTCFTVVAVVASRADVGKKLHDREKSIRMILANSPDAVLGFDADGCCIFAGGPTEALLGTAAESLIGVSWRQLADKWPGLENLFDGSDTVVDLQATQGICLEASLAPLDDDEGGSGSVVTFHDITTRALRERELEKKAYTDDLTKVLNRAGFHQSVQEAMDEGGICTLALIDVDHFKIINDQFGHNKGDDVLARIGECLKAEIRMNDLVGRIGGDEFAILFRADAHTAEQICNRILDRCRALANSAKDGRLLRVTFSCGVAEMVPGWTKAQLFHTADETLYEVKAQGRNAVRMRA